MFGRKSSENLEKKVKELETLLDKLEDNLIHDPLTGLKTRAFFDHEVGVYLEIMSRPQSRKGGISQRRERFGFRNLSIVFLDIDFFKKVNDEYGHEIGDLVLKKVAETVNRSVRTGDTAARWGGEELVVSLLGASEHDAATKAEEIRAAIEKLEFPNLPAGKAGAPKLKVTVSTGVASSESGLILEALIKRADQALYRAKQTGRNKVIAYSELTSNML
mgnify:CR=1 FL=1